MAQPKDWGATKDSHPHLCDSCKHAAVADAHEADRQELPEPLPEWAERKHFLRYARRPRCTECRAACTDERWQAVERTGGDALPPERRPTLCGDCDQRHEIDWEQTWPGAIRQDQDQAQDQAVPEQKATGWLSRLRR
ncbi:hypothetical protein [Streptomyces sp. NBC_01431]|uniref:hypothetical protein n=1 Tax=Streptomyces sp. NBC_01431 TaxID=2903863 RepID=UPI002E34CD22|nr:hypothetical protein [Streptomyces sp. NBC_01431]